MAISASGAQLGRNSKAGDFFGGLPATGIAVYVADICPPQNPIRDAHSTARHAQITTGRARGRVGAGERRAGRRMWARECCEMGFRTKQTHLVRQLELVHSRSLSLSVCV